MLTPSFLKSWPWRHCWQNSFRQQQWRWPLNSSAATPVSVLQTQFNLKEKKQSDYLFHPHCIPLSESHFQIPLWLMLQLVMHFAFDSTENDVLSEIKQYQHSSCAGQLNKKSLWLLFECLVRKSLVTGRLGNNFEAAV